MPRPALQIRSALQRIFDAKTIGPFLVASVTLGILSNGLYELAADAIGRTPWRLGMLVAAAFVIFGGCVLIVAANLKGGPACDIGKGKPGKRRGLIFLVSQEPPCRKAVEYHRGALERCWLICSAATLEMANRLREEIRSGGIDVPEPIVVNDVHDPAEFRDEIVKIYEHLPEGFRTSDVIADYLGMTSHATAGVVLAWSELEFPLQYTLPMFDHDRKPTGAADPIEISLGPPRGGSRNGRS
jgi:hypothetical protein